MKLAKYYKPIFAEHHTSIDGTESYGLKRDLFEKETDYTFQLKKDKLRRDLYYNQVLYIRRNTTICSECGKRRWRKDIKIYHSPYQIEPIRKCRFCDDPTTAVDATC
jgi:hypothetical protein